jgi:hypothetical protein
MGKRKLHTVTYYQCEWTGFAMKSPNCYMPTWNAAGKLVKRGNYCNWESVKAHALQLQSSGEISANEFLKVCEYLGVVTGWDVVPAAPHYTELLHIDGRLDALGFHEVCTRQHTVTAVKITAAGAVEEVTLSPDNGKIPIHQYLTAPSSFHSAPSVFHSMRKKGAKLSERDMCVWYYPSKDLPPNTTASNQFKMQLYGDVLLLHQSREASFLPRERYTDFTRAHYDEVFTKKRKRLEPNAIAPGTYAVMKAEMQDKLNQFEQKVAVQAEPPMVMSRTQTTAPTDGHELAKKLKGRVVAPNTFGPPPIPQCLQAAA